MRPKHFFGSRPLSCGAALASIFLLVSPPVASATELTLDMTGFRLALAQSAASDRGVADYYRARDYAPIWTAPGPEAAARRAALMAAIDMAPLHGLPDRSADRQALVAQMQQARSTEDLGDVEMALTLAFLDVARDLQTGILTPSSVDPEIIREVPLRDTAHYLNGIQSGDPLEFVKSLPPRSPEYLRLMKARMDLQRGIRAGGFGPAVNTGTLRPGDSGPGVIALRDRLVRMGYMPRSVSASYDSAMQKAVLAFQKDHGLAEDGIAGGNTMSELNVPAEDRLKSVTVALERERWMNMDRGDRHVLVNLADFTAKIMDEGKVTYETRAVVGEPVDGQRSPEFSDVMEYLVLNPTWHVPRSITVNEYLPKLRANPYAVPQLNVVDSQGRVVPRGAVNFAAYNARNFPFSLKEPPSDKNALGLVKFIFPNRNNIYLHDTPAKSLFQHASRAFSHGCIRLQEPFEFAYELLSRQEADPAGFFHSTLSTRKETRVNLETQVPVHLDYRTAFTSAKGQVNYRRDVYGRDAAIWRALEAQGVALGAVGS